MTASPPKLPPSPKALGPAGRSLWKRAVDDYELGVGELELLEAACATWDRIKAAEQLIAEEGLVIDGARGRQAHPAVGIARDSSRLLAALVKHLKLELTEEVVKHRGTGGRPTTSRRRREP